MCPPDYHDIGFVATHTLGRMRAYCFHDCMYITSISLLWDLSTLQTYIYIYIYNYDYKIQVNYAINGIPEKAFRSDLSTQIKKTSRLTNYLLGITFSCYLFVLGSFVTFLLWWPIIAFVFIIYSVLSFCTIF